MPLFIDWMKEGLGKCTIIGLQGHLEWPFTNTSRNKHLIIQKIYNIILAIGFITLNTEWYGFFYTGIASLAYFTSKTIYGHSWGSIWCHFVNILAIGSIFI
jgi:hypothetical protein